MPSKSRENAFPLLVQLYTLGRQVRSLSKHRNQDLMEEALILSCLARRPANATAIGELLAVKISAASEKISKLTAKGWIDKSVEVDQREKMLALTESGWTEFRRLEKLMQAHSQVVFSDFSSEEADALSVLIDKLMASIQGNKHGQ